MSKKLLLLTFQPGSYIKIPSLQDLSNGGFIRIINDDIHGLGTLAEPMSKLHFSPPFKPTQTPRADLCRFSSSIGIFSNLLGKTWKIVSISGDYGTGKIKRLSVEVGGTVEHISPVLLNELERVGWDFEHGTGLTFFADESDLCEEAAIALAKLPEEVIQEEKVDERSPQEIIGDFETSLNPKKKEFTYEGTCQHEFPAKKIFNLYICLKCQKEYQYDPRPSKEES